MCQFEKISQLQTKTNRTSCTYIAVVADLNPLADAGRDLVVGDAEVHPGLEPVQVGQSQAVPRVGRHLVSRYVDIM